MPIKVLGLEELARNLQKYGEAGREALEDGLEAAANVVRDAVQDRAPIDNSGKVHYPVFGRRDNEHYVPLSKVRRSGNLYKTITIQKVESKDLANGPSVFKIGPGKGGFYGYFLEFGTRKTPKHPFVRPAFDQSHEAAIRAAESAIAKKLQGVK